MVLVCKVLKNPAWCGLQVEFLVGLWRTWDQKLSSGLFPHVHDLLTSSNSASQMLISIG